LAASSNEEVKLAVKERIPYVFCYCLLVQRRFINCVGYAAPKDGIAGNDEFWRIWVEAFLVWFRLISQHPPGESEDHENVNQCSWYSGRYSKPLPPDTKDYSHCITTLKWTYVCQAGSLQFSEVFFKCIDFLEVYGLEITENCYKMPPPLYRRLCKAIPTWPLEDV